MDRSGILPILACAGELLLLILVLWRGRRSPLAVPLIALSVVAFGWNFTGIASALSGDQAWYWLDIALSPLTAPVAFHLVLAFTGRRLALRAVMRAAYLFFAVLAAYGVVALFVPGVRWLYEAHYVPLVHLGAASVLMIFALVLLGRHLRASPDAAERTRTRLLLCALAFATPMALTEVLAELGVAVPHLGALGVLVGNSLVVMVALRLDVFDRPLGLADGLYALTLTVLCLGLYLALVEHLAGRTAVLVFATSTLTLVLAAAGRQLHLKFRAQRVQLERYAQVGRLSAQLGHDLKNPLAALRGAAQFLDAELAEGRPLDAHRPFLALIVDQADRMQRVIDDYRRLGSMQLETRVTDLNALVQNTVALQPFAAPPNVAVRAELEPELPSLPVDPELVTRALHNLVQNACDAMPESGELTVRTQSVRTGEAPWVVLTVSDTGPGMDARTRERAFDEFFTTRPTGTGLGLSLVRRVAQAHGGRVQLHSREGRGTRVELWLPVAR